MLRWKKENNNRRRTRRKHRPHFIIFSPTGCKKSDEKVAKHAQFPDEQHNNLTSRLYGIYKNPNTFNIRHFFHITCNPNSIIVSFFFFSGMKFKPYICEHYNGYQVSILFCSFCPTDKSALYSHVSFNDVFKHKFEFFVQK